MNHHLHYPVRTEALRKYLNQSTILGTLCLWLPAFLLFLAVVNKKSVSAEMAILHFFIWFVAVPLPILYFSLKSIPRYIDALSYRLEGNVLRVDEGIFTRKQQAIPVDLISEININEGWIMRRYSVSMLTIQTGAAFAGGGAVLWGVKNPEDVRDTLLRLRNEAVGNFGRTTTVTTPDRSKQFF